MEELTGVMHQEVKGKSWFDTFIPPRERDRLRDVFHETVTRSETSRSGQLHHDPRGTRTTDQLVQQNAEGRDGETVAVLSVGQDITDLNQAQQRALQAERLAGIGQMSTGLAHESRNALQRIQACAEMLELEVEGNAEAMDLVRRIKLAQDHMHRLFDEVRGYAAPVNLDCSGCNLGSIWREAWEILLPQWEDRIAELVENTSDVPLSLHWRPFPVGATVPNPVRKRLGGLCTIRSVSRSLAVQPFWPAHEAIRISVRDNGPGLNQEQQERIFEPFYTTKTKGTGLGMAIAQRIVEAHEGKIEVGNPATRGTEIIITLPFLSTE